MLFESARPSPRSFDLRWKYRSIPPGTQFRAWTAGPMVGVHVHWSSSSKPCRKRITGGKLPCSLCEAKMKCRWVGYVPVLDHPHLRQYVLILSETVGNAFSVTGLGQFMEFTRTIGARDPLQFRALLPGGSDAPLRIPSTIQNLKPCDITPWLLHLWQDDELSAFLLKQQAPEATPERNGSSQTEVPRVHSPASPSTNGADHAPDPATTTRPTDPPAGAGPDPHRGRNRPKRK
jgi:hypothetical protein